MKRLFLFNILSLLSLCLCLGQNQIIVTPAGEMPRAVSGHFAGIVDGQLTTWGGCNFPDVPCADGGQKVFYPKAYGASVTVPEGTVYIGGQGPLPESPLPALPSVACAPQSLCSQQAIAPLGESLNAAEIKSDNECLLVEIKPSPKGAAALRHSPKGGAGRGLPPKEAAGRGLPPKEAAGRGLPSLPKGLDNFAACYGMDRIFVAGGQTDGVPNRDVYALDWPDGKEWVKIATLPDAGRLQPCMAVQNAPEGKALYIFGGYFINSKFKIQNSNEAVVYTSGLKLNLKTFEWQETSPASIKALPKRDSGIKALPQRGSGEGALVGSCCSPSGYSHILFFGGVNYDIFLSAIEGRQDSMYLRHEPAWYKFRKDVLAYHTITDSWMLLPGDDALARAGAALTPKYQIVNSKSSNSKWIWFYSGGELKPGIRTAEISTIEVKHDTHFGFANWAVLIFYLIAMLGMGIYFMRRENGAEDFFKGGGRIPWWAAGISIYATMLSAITYMAIPAKRRGRACRR